MLRFAVAIAALGVACSSPAPPPVAPAPVVAPSPSPPPPPAIVVDAAPAGPPPLSLAEGQQLFEHTCQPCHSLDGSMTPGPTMKGYIGAKLQLDDGTVVIGSAERIAAALHAPQPLQGFQPTMPNFDGYFNSQQIAGLVAFVVSVQ
ncbi:MAG TPA: cytochrome c [Kofleriaceae bacterium]|jgi:mono/diheme cytochrome c family protein